MNKLDELSQKKNQLAKLKQLPKEVAESLEQWYKVELTYSSNAIEGNTLSRQETAEVIERGPRAVISGKPLKDLLEARNHADALEFVKELAKKLKSHQNISEDDIKTIHKIILTGIDDSHAGVYRQTDVFMRGSDVEFPSPKQIPTLMSQFISWLQSQQDTHSVKIASDAHFKFVSIHPFIDGNGRTTRLLMNLILTLNNYPMAIIRNEERTNYLSTFDSVRKENNMQPFYDLIEAAVERSLDAYINAGQGKPIMPTLLGEVTEITNNKLLKIGQLAKAANETIPTIRWWTKEKLLEVTKYTDGGLYLYDPSQIDQAKEIRYLQNEQRLTLEEIKQKYRIKKI